MFLQAAGWSSLVARKAHILEVAGSNPAPATNLTSNFQTADFDSTYGGSNPPALAKKVWGKTTS